MSAIVHHPDASTLLGFAAGSLPEPLAAVVAVHLDMCRRCNGDVAALNGVGGTLLEALPPVPLNGPRRGVSLDSLRHREPGADDGGGRRIGHNGPPQALTRLAGPDLSAVAWRRIAPGLWHKRLPLSPGVKGDLRLVKVAPGQTMPEHGHGGSELTLVLDGAYRDEVGCFLAGDVADLDDEIEHQPVADPHVGCICLIASERKARFKSLLARLLQPLTGF